MESRQQFLGKQVKVILDKDEWIVRDNPNPKPVIIAGKLLSFSDAGEFVIEDDAGDIHYCWPMLTIELADE